jgi:putative tricarboxylic transport membrane protein
MAFKKSGVDPKTLRYIPYDAGAKAMVSLLSGEVQLLSSGLSEALALAEQGEVRILAMTAATRVDHAPDVPAMTELGVDMVFTNWRGFFGAPGLSADKVQEFQELLSGMYDTAEWEDLRLQRGWSNLFISGDEFVVFLSEQEKAMGLVMDELGLR